MFELLGRRPVIVAVGVLALAACGESGTEPEVDPFPAAPDDTLPYTYVAPARVGDGWTVGRAGDVGLSEERLTEMVDILRDGPRGGPYRNVHGVVIVKDGVLVMEEYFNGMSFEGAVQDSILGRWTTFDRTTAHNLASVTKSIASTLVGVAIQEELISRVDTAVYDFFPEFADQPDPRKDSITLEHLLTLTSGLDWDEATYPSGYPRNDINALFRQSDPIAYILSKGTPDPPGTRWLYNGGGTNVLGEVVARTSGMSLVDFADEYLFGPLGITDREWVLLANSVTYASGDLRLRPRDMAKIGSLFLTEGRWNGEAVLSPEWVAQAVEERILTWDPPWGYGYQWWTFDWPVNGNVYPSFGARGWGGQVITVFPTLDMVVVLTGGNYRTSDPTDAIIAEFVLDALVERP